MSAPAPAPAPTPTRSRYLLVFAIVYLVHLALLAYALPVSVLLGDQPFAAPDYQTHYEQTSTIRQLVDRFGHFWGYDPNLLAGQPAGLIFDVDNKLHFLFTHGLNKLGVGLASAFNLFTLLSGLLAPLSLWLAARLFSIGRRAELFTLGSAVLLWHFDSSPRFCWTAGMISFATVAHGSLAVIALFYRWTERRSLGAYAALLLLLPLVLLAHVWAFAIMVVPLTALYLRNARRLGTAGHAQVWGLALFAITVNLYWLLPALRNIDWIAPSGVVGQTNPLYLLTDWFEILVNPVNTAFIMPHTMFRFVLIAGAALTLWRWRKEGDRRLFIAMLMLCWMFGMAYFAALVPVLRETEPYRFIIPAILSAAIFGSPWVAQVLEPGYLRALPRHVQVLLVVVLILIVPRAAQQVLYFIPELSPELQLPPLIVNQSNTPPTGLTQYPAVPKSPPMIATSWRLKGVGDNGAVLARFIDKDCAEPGRVLVQHWAVGEYLRWATTKPIIGGFPDRRLIHEAAYVFRRPDDPRLFGKGLADYLVRYNVRYLVMTDPIEPIERRRDLFEPLKLMGPHRIYRVRHRANYFSAGSGRVSAELNRIVIDDARPAAGGQSLTIKFHFMRTLRCRPGCRLERVVIPHDRVGFIRVVGEPTLPRKITIEQRY